MAKNNPSQTTPSVSIEQNDHRNASRLNNPPIGLVDDAESPVGQPKTFQYDPHIDPSLQWAGKAERTTFDTFA